jgi:hypothetical protein
MESVMPELIAIIYPTEQRARVAGVEQAQRIPHARRHVVKTTRRYNARANMMLALVEGIHRALTSLGRAWRALTSRFTMSRRNRALSR